ncbi:MAG: SCO family protein [Solirubrobacterales bacterium]|nr:SCO family protein [Solirubrobacterales bacterium]
MKSRRIVLVFGILFAVAMLSLSPLLSARARNASIEPSLPVLYELPDFQLTDSDGAPFDRSRMRGKVWVADFIFTTCTGPCPLLSTRMAGLHKTFKGDSQVGFVSISVDPDTDTPAVMAAYAKRYGADTSQWHFLTGPKDAINELAVKGFKVGSGDVPVMHDLHFILVDDVGRIRGYYTGTNPDDVADLQRDIEILLEDMPR